MKVQVGTGKAFYAKRMVPITRAHVAASAQEGDVYWVTKLVEAGARCVISPTVNPSMDLKYVEEHLAPLAGEGRDRVEASNEAYRRIGATMTLSCTPEIEKNVPAFGEIVAFSESSATPYVNSVLGARTNRESSISALCAAVTGRVPEYGLLLDENRRGEVVVDVEATLEDDFDWSLLGYAYPQVYKGPEVPVFTGIGKRPTPEGFVQFGAELATSGAVAMYHVVGITPEAPTVEAALGGNAVKARVTITDADLERVLQFAR
jgi:predicted aconitase